MIQAELQRDAFLKAQSKGQMDDTVRLIEAFSSDKWNLDDKRPGMFNRHQLFGDIKRNERLAQIFKFMALENLRSAFNSITNLSAKDLVDSEEMTSSYIGFTSRSVAGKERQYMSKTVSEVISTKTEQAKKGGVLSNLVPFRRNK